MSTAIVKKSTDTGVPLLSGTGGSLAALIRHIAPILGWSIEFDNSTDIIVVKPQSYRGGQPVCYRVDDTAARGGIAPKAAKVQMYESMADINTGTGLCGTFYISKSYYSSTAASAWAVIGDQYGMYIITPMTFYAAQQSPVMLHYMGFIELYNNAASSVCVGTGCADSITVGEPYINSTCILRDSSAVSSPYSFLHRNSAGTLGVNCCTVFNGGVHPVNKCTGHLESAMPAYSGSLMIARPFLNDGSAYSVRGYLPGLYYPCHSDESLSGIGLTPIITGTPLTVDGRTFVGQGVETQSSSSSYGHGIVIFEISGGFRP